MTTPATGTPGNIIASAMRDAGLLQLGDEPSSEHLAQHMVRLNDMANMWIIQGLKLWLLADTAVTPVAGQQKYTFKPSGDVNMTKPLRVLQGYYLDSTGTTRRPIYPLSWDEWLRLSTVTQTGQVSQFFVDKQQTELDVYMWLIPDATAAAGRIHLLLETQVTNVISLTDTVAFPIQWTLALRWGLADEICTGQPQAIVERCATRAGVYRDALEGWDVEDTGTSFAPDQRAGNYGVSQFQ